MANSLKESEKPDTIKRSPKVDQPVVFFFTYHQQLILKLPGEYHHVYHGDVFRLKACPCTKFYRNSVQRTYPSCSWIMSSIQTISSSWHAKQNCVSHRVLPVCIPKLTTSKSFSWQNSKLHKNLQSLEMDQTATRPWEVPNARCPRKYLKQNMSAAEQENTPTIRLLTIGLELQSITLQGREMSRWWNAVLKSILKGAISYIFSCSDLYQAVLRCY